MRVSMKVDGVTYEDEVEPRKLLTHHLRDGLGRVGTPIGCDTSNCGACVVDIDGESVKSCSVLAVQADGADITTIQGLANGQAGSDGWHPVQKAFQQHHGLQCGYCTPGMIMSAVDLLKRNPSPTEDEVRHGLEGNLCRCTGYQNIVRAVMSAASDMRGEGPLPGSFRDAADDAKTGASA
jgi:aerobic carbon-monoxide dehydrogenase small subunit